jgi:type I restriction enzyme M protein
LYKDRNAFLDALEIAFEKSDTRLMAPIKKAILAALSERDETAEICRDADGNPEADPELRDYENIPQQESIEAYFAKEVLPHIPDGWVNEETRDSIDAGVGKVGYSIPLTRHFYVYRPPADLAQLEATVRSKVTEIAKVFGEVAK